MIAQQRNIYGQRYFLLAIKIPMWPVHTWLPDAHVQAPTAGSVILQVLIKLGAYAMMRLMLLLGPDTSIHFQDFVLILGVTAIIYTSIVALVLNNDMQRNQLFIHQLLTWVT